METASSGSVDSNQESGQSAHSLHLLYAELTQGSELIQAVNILVVDNNPDCLFVWEVLFQSYGARVMVCRSIKEAVASLEDCVPDILISEVSLSDETVSPLIKRAKHIAVDNGREIHVIITSTYVFADFVRCFYSLTADVSAYFCKPIDITEFVNTVLKLLRKKSKPEHYTITNVLE